MTFVRFASFLRIGLTAPLLLTTACDDGPDSGESAATEGSDATGGDETTAEASTTGTSSDAESDSGSNSGDSAASTTADTPTSGDTSEGTSGDGTSTGELVLADIEVTVNYEGEFEGRVIVAALTEWPPTGPPLASIGEDEPTFPWTGTLLALEPNEYYIFAMVDVGLDNPTQPGDEDPNTLADMNVIVEDVGPYSVEITLEDPE